MEGIEANFVGLTMEKGAGMAGKGTSEGVVIEDGTATRGEVGTEVGTVGGRGDGGTDKSGEYYQQRKVNKFTGSGVWCPLILCIGLTIVVRHFV